MQENEAALNNFRTSLAKFTFTENRELRKSPPKSIAIQARSSKRQSSSTHEDSAKIDAPSPKKKLKRSYAPPETYAHLRELQDHLKPDLDVIFCGINPGKKSAEIGHHFGNPSNHFWWCLHHSGFTDVQLPPEEDFMLPERYSLGLTNLVDRPTSEQTELSIKEQLESVPVFLAKVARYRPRIVCFVGLGIAKVVESKLKLVPTKSWGLRPYKMNYSSDDASSESSCTLFFATPSTSGRVTHFKRPEKANTFREMRIILEELKAGRPPALEMIEIQAPEVLTDPTSDPRLMLLLPGLIKLEEREGEDGAGDDERSNFVKVEVVDEDCIARYP